MPKNNSGRCPLPKAPRISTFQLPGHGRGHSEQDPGIQGLGYDVFGPELLNNAGTRKFSEAVFRLLF